MVQLTRWEPVGEFTKLRNQMDRMFEELRREVEEERRRIYQEKYGELEPFEEDSDLLEFN